MRAIFILLLLFRFTVFFAQPPAGYYNATQGLSGEPLRQALHNIITNGHQTLSYSNLMGYYMKTDVKANGKVWDMYSDIPGGTPPYEFTFVTNACGSYNSEADCYNREHSVPASWFGDDYPMYADILQVVPTDGWVNNKRSNYPFGKVGSASWTSLNGSKLGSNSFAGYSGTVFEPIDSFKGDFARIYFYMATRYKDEIGSWSSAMFAGNDLTTYGKNLMYAWHLLDPVSQKEIARNDSVYKIQFNRNPYVDNPQWVAEIWGPQAGTDYAEISQWKTYPQPASDYLFIETLMAPETASVIITDITGRQMVLSEPYSQNMKVNVSELKPGIYILVIDSGFKKINITFIKEQP
jgi:endonuclease I